MFSQSVKFFVAKNPTDQKDSGPKKEQFVPKGYTNPEEIDSNESLHLVNLGLALARN
jgi:hypothetical protein